MTFNIIVPGRFAEAKDPVKVCVPMKGRFLLQAVKWGGVVRERVFDNLITDLGLNAMGDTAFQNIFNQVRVGTGTTPPSPSDTAIQNPVAGGGFSLSDDSISPGLAPSWQSVRTFVGTSSIGQFGNNNLTEIGIGNSSGALFSRALILDSLGNPTAFPISDTEQLRVTYMLSQYPPLGDVIAEVDVSGIRQTVTRPLQVNNTTFWKAPGRGNNQANGVFPSPGRAAAFSGDIVAVNGGFPTGQIGSDQAATRTSMPYVQNSMKRASRAIAGVTAWNSSNITSIRHDYESCSFQTSYDPPMQKTNEQTMFLDFELSWGRHDP